MKGDCPKCGFPLNKGNIKVVRPRGKKRPYRIHRRCPEEKPVQLEAPFVPPVESPLHGAIGFEHIEDPIRGRTADATRLQRPQDTTDGPANFDVVFWVYETPRYRYFMTPDQAERVKAALEKQMAGFGVGFEVIPVPEDQVEADPDAFADLVEVTVNWKDE